MKNINWLTQLIITGTVICGIIGGLCAVIATAAHHTNNQLLIGHTHSLWFADNKAYIDYQTGRTK